MMAVKFAAATCAPGVFTNMSCHTCRCFISQWWVLWAIQLADDQRRFSQKRCRAGGALWTLGWTSWASTPILTLVAEPAWPYLVLHLLALRWPLVDIDFSLLLSGPVQALLWSLDLALCWPCFFALLIWPWAGHAAYRSWAGLDSLHCCSRPCAGLLLFYLDKLWCGGNYVPGDWLPGGLPGLHPLHCLRQCRLELDRRVPPETTTPRRTPTSRCSAVHPPTTRNGGRGSTSMWWRWGSPNENLKDSWASSEASLAQHGSFLRTSPSTRSRKREPLRRCWRRWTKPLSMTGRSSFRMTSTGTSANFNGDLVRPSWSTRRSTTTSTASWLTMMWHFHQRPRMASPPKSWP